MPRVKKNKNSEFISAIGRRKESVARIRLCKGKGETLVNNMPIERYFQGEVARLYKTF